MQRENRTMIERKWNNDFMGILDELDMIVIYNEGQLSLVSKKETKKGHIIW